MASWMIHLRIADELLGRLPGLDAALFAIGNVAPDSGMPDERWENFNPPPTVTHFQNPDNVNRDCGDLVFFREYLQVLRLQDDPPGFSFRLGYFFHLVIDNLWSRRIGRPTQERFSAQFSADRDFIWEVKKDWYGLDFMYVRGHPEGLFWRVFVPAGYDRADLDFLPREAVPRQLAYIKQYYQRRDPEVEELFRRPYIYLSRAEADDFVAESVQRLVHIHGALLREHVDTTGHTSALVLSL